MAKTVTISIEAEGSEVGLSAGRTVTMRRPPNRALGEPSWAARRPGWGNARGSVDRLIGVSLEPRMTAAEVSALAPLKQPREQVYEAVLDGLEEVVLKTPVIAALRAALDSMPFLSKEQRHWLEHGLEHAERGEWLQAVPPLFLGYEGGLYNSAIDVKAIPETSRGKLMAAEKIIKAFELEDALEAFALKLVFGGRGNSFRHGRPENQARDQVLLMVVAIVAWVDFLFDTHGTERLVRELRDPLDRALERGEATGLRAVA